MTEPIDVIAALRGATHSRHERLDTRMPLAKPDASLDDYRAHLDLLRRWLAPLAQWSATFDDGPQDCTLLPPLATLPQIEADLRHPSLASSTGEQLDDDRDSLAQPAQPAHRAHNARDVRDVHNGRDGHYVHDGRDGRDARAPIDDAARWTGTRSAAYRWGVAYVIEGARLGGAVLYRRLGAQLAPHPLTYLQGSAAGPGPRWQAFLRAARAQVVGEAAIAEACAGACDAFDSIIGLLDAAGAADAPGRARLRARDAINS
jgi:heme oxygenase